MRAEIMGLLLSAVLFAGSASAYDAHDPNNCNGVNGMTTAPWSYRR